MTTDNNISITESKEEEKNSKISKNSHFKLFGLLIVLNILTAIGIILYFKTINYNQYQQLQQQIHTTKNEQGQELALITTKINSLSKNINLKVNEFNTQIAESLQKIPVITNDWLLQKAKYYLEVAVINNNWTDDVNTTKSLLIAADDTLKNIQDIDVSAVRKLIAEEELELDAANMLDTIKVLAEINAINSALKDLPIISTPTKVSNNETTTANKDNLNWKETLQNSLQKLNKMIIIHRNAENDTPILSPIFARTVHEIIRLNLQQMQLAVLEKNQDLYDFSCNQAISNINLLFEDSNQHKMAILLKLNNLKEIKFISKRNKIGKSLQKLNSLINRPLRKITSSTNSAKTRGTESTKQFGDEVEISKNSELRLD